MIPESRRLRRGRARPCQKSVAAHTQAGKQGRGKGPGKAEQLRSTGQGGSSRKKTSPSRMRGRKISMARRVTWNSQARGSAPSRSLGGAACARSSPRLPAQPCSCSLCPGTGKPPQHYGGISSLGTAGVRHCSLSPGPGSIQAWDTCFGEPAPGPASSSAGLSNY